MSERSCPSRRDFLLFGTGALAVAAIPWARGSERTLVRRTVPAMGTTAELAVLHRDQRYAHAALDAAVLELQRIERLMTRFDAGSDVGRANRLAALEPVAVSPDTARLLRLALEWAERTDGAFDPCLARLTELWDVKHRDAPPPRSELARLADRKLYRALDVDSWRGESVVRYADPDVALDLGGIACGYGIDRVVAIFRDWGVRDGFVDVGGDIYALGHALDEPWRVGVRDPYHPGALLTSVGISDAAIATSGDYEQFFDYDGRRYGHILDPITAEPRRARTHTVTITAADVLTVDAATTAVFGSSRMEAEGVLARIPGVELVHMG